MPGFINYPGLVVTTIKLVGLPDDKTIEDLVDGDKVRFNEMEGNAGSKVCFLKNIVQDPNESGTDFFRVYDATYVSPVKAAEMADLGYGNGKCTPLFFVHGMNNDPGYIMEQSMPKAMARLKGEELHYPIPVLWPTTGGRLAYLDDQKYALKAGINLKALVDDIPNDIFPKKNLMCHSMGNHLVFNGACGVELPNDPNGPPGDAPDVKWENIFFVAADLPRDVFAENPSEGTFGYKKKKAENLKAMLVDGGKIYVIHHPNDVVLAASTIKNFGERLGRLGPNEIRPDFRDTIVTIDGKPYTDATWPRTDDWKRHSYHLEQWACDIYSNAVKDLHVFQAKSEGENKRKRDEAEPAAGPDIKK